jgi:hypothetical protein
MSDYELLAACRAAIWMRFALKQDMSEAMWLALHDKLKARQEALKTAADELRSHSTNPVKLWDWVRDYADDLSDTHDAVMLREVAQNYEDCVKQLDRREARNIDVIARASCVCPYREAIEGNHRTTCPAKDFVLCQHCGTLTSWSDVACESCGGSPVEALCPHGFVVAENVCGPCSEGRPNRGAGHVLHSHPSHLAGQPHHHILVECWCQRRESPVEHGDKST